MASKRSEKGENPGQIFQVTDGTCEQISFGENVFPVVDGLVELSAEEAGPFLEAGMVERFQEPTLATGLSQLFDTTGNTGKLKK